MQQIVPNNDAMQDWYNKLMLLRSSLRKQRRVYRTQEKKKISAREQRKVNFGSQKAHTELRTTATQKEGKFG